MSIDDLPMSMDEWQGHTGRKKGVRTAPDIASASVPDTLAALHVNPDTGLTHAEMDVCRREHGYNEVAEQGVAVDHNLCTAILLRPGGGQSELKRESLGGRKRACLF